MMDSFQEFQEITIRAKNYFYPSFYEEYEAGRMVSKGNTTMKIEFYSDVDGSVVCNISSNDLPGKLTSARFDKCITLHDRILMLSCPQKTNANILAVTMMRATVGVTCLERNYKCNEPVVGSLYTDDGRLVKMSFTISNPERLLELYI